MTKSFRLSGTPQLFFGPGAIRQVPDLAAMHGSRILLVTGARSFDAMPESERLLEAFDARGLMVERTFVSGEPSPRMIDSAVAQYIHFNADLVVAIGGGSVLDAGKAIAAMLTVDRPVTEFLEGVGNPGAHPGSSLPFIAVPTTAGTGSEATSNAVLSAPGPGGFKKSLRHENFIPAVAVVDPLLSVSCPPSVTAFSGLDAFTQLLESFMSTKANDYTDAVALSGMKSAIRSLVRVYRDGAREDARGDMAWAAYLSGIALTNAGLGVVHGFASAIGGYLPIAHNIVCSALIVPANAITIEKLRKQNDGHEPLSRYAAVGRLMGGDHRRPDGYYVDYLLDEMRSWTTEMQVPKLRALGMKPEHVAPIIAATGNKNHPVLLDEGALREILEMAI